MTSHHFKKKSHILCDPALGSAPALAPAPPAGLAPRPPDTPAPTGGPVRPAGRAVLHSSHHLGLCENVRSFLRLHPAWTSSARLA